VRDLRFVDGVPDIDESLEVQVRAHGTPVPGRLDGSCVRFEQPQPRVAPGQVVALYAGDTLLGGGIAT
jgi:tRNA U34 2-thiouridine synthase MnmA/TrmU